MMFQDWDENSFRDQYRDGLIHMLGRNTFGGWILVLANSMQDPDLRTVLRLPLDDAFAMLKATLPEGSDDDIEVFDRIRQGAPHKMLSHWHSASRDAWKLVTNPMRQFRPMRLSRDPLHSLYRAFDPDGFNFSKADLEPEVFKEGEWNGVQLRVLYNKFPFAPWHLIMVPDPYSQNPQYITREYHVFAMALVAELSTRLPGVTLAYNSLGAGASVNHLHFQFSVIEELLPIEETRWKHHGGDESYPIECIHSDDADEAWYAIDERQLEGKPFNIIYRDGRCYLMKRKSLAEVDDCKLPQGVTWYESAGVFVFPDSPQGPFCPMTSLGKYRC